MQAATSRPSEIVHTRGAERSLPYSDEYPSVVWQRWGLRWNRIWSTFDDDPEILSVPMQPIPTIIAETILFYDGHFGIPWNIIC